MMRRRESERVPNKNRQKTLNYEFCMGTRSKGRLDSSVLVLGWVSFLTDVASDMIYPLLPDFLTRTLHAGPAALGLIEGVAEATASFMKMLSGWWADRVR